MPTNQLSASNAQSLRDLTNKQIALAWWNKAVWLQNAKNILANTKTASGTSALDIAKEQYKSWIANSTTSITPPKTPPLKTPTTSTTPTADITIPTPTPITNTPAPTNVIDANQNVLQANLDEKKRIEEENKQNQEKVIQAQEDAKLKQEEDKKLAEDLAKKQEDLNKQREQNAKDLEQASQNIIEQQKQQSIDLLNNAKLKTEALNNERLASQEVATKLQKEADNKAIEQAKVEMDVAQQQANWAMWKLWITFSSYAVWQTQQIANKWALAIAQLKVTANSNQMLWVTALNDIKQKTIDLETSYTQSINKAINNASTASLKIKEATATQIDDINNNRLLNETAKAKKIAEITQQYRDDKKAALDDFYTKAKEISQDHIDNATAISNQIQIWNKAQLDRLNQSVLDWSFAKLSLEDKAKLEAQLWMSTWTIDLMIKAQTTKSIRESLQNAIWKDYLPSLNYINSLSEQVKWLMDTWMWMEEAVNAIVWKALPQNADYKTMKEAKKSSLDQQKLEFEKAKFAIESWKDRATIINDAIKNGASPEDIKALYNITPVYGEWSSWWATTITTQITDKAKENFWDKNIQCWVWANYIAKENWRPDIKFWDKLSDKQNQIDKIWNNGNTPEVWWFFISNPLNNWIWHVWYVKSINWDWTITVTDANWDNKDISKWWPLKDRIIKITPWMTFSKTILNQWQSTTTLPTWTSDLKTLQDYGTSIWVTWASTMKDKTILQNAIKVKEDENKAKEWKKNEDKAVQNIKSWIELNPQDKKEMLKWMGLEDMYNSMVKSTENPSTKIWLLKAIWTWWYSSDEAKMNKILNARIKESNIKAKEFIKKARAIMWNGFWLSYFQTEDNKKMQIQNKYLQNQQLKSLMEAKWYKVNENDEFVAPNWEIIW